MFNCSDIVRFCAFECEKQHVGPMAVANMFEAYEYARIVSDFSLPDMEVIRILGEKIEPMKNIHGFRTTPVSFADGKLALDWKEIPNAMERLLTYCNVTENPVEFYRQFEMIHPFIDGNGRVGAILYNWKNLKDGIPLPPPDLFGSNK